MVRIRSDRWYSGENQKKIRRGAPSNASGTRRVVSLVFLLALVMLLMQKVSNPQTISQAFRSLGMPLDQPVVDATHPELMAVGSTKSNPSADQSKVEKVTPARAESGSEPGSEPGSQSGSEAAAEQDLAWTKTCRDLLPRVLEVATVEQVEQLALLIFSADHPASRQPRSTISELDIRPILEPLQSRLDLSQQNDKLWNERLLRFQTQWDLLIGLSKAEVNQLSEATKLDDQFRKQLSDELDQRLLRTLRDASPWIGSETVGFGRLLQRSRAFASVGKNASQVSTRQLDTEFSKLRGEWVKFRGTVRLVETVKRPQPLLDQSVYYVLWLRGQDQAAQPVAVYTAQAIAEKFAREVQSEQFPEVEVIGLVGKKLAYGSASGVQVTPTLFADAIVQFASSQATAKPASPGITNTQWMLGSAAVIVGGLFFAVPVWKQLRKRKRVTTSASVLMAACLFAQWSCSSAWAYSPQTQPQVSAASEVAGQDPPWNKKGDIALQLKQIAEQRLQPLFTPELRNQLAEIIEGRATEAPDFVLRSIYAIKQAGWKQLWDSTHSIKLNEQFSLVPAELEGTVRVVQSLNLSDFQQEWFSVQTTRSIYRLQVEMNSKQQDASQSSSAPSSSGQTTSPQLVTVFCVNVPSIWKSSAQLKQPVRIKGFQLAKLPGGESAQVVCHIADRLSWRVDSVSEESFQQMMPRLPEAWSQLGRQGWDLAWFDLLAENNKRTISGDEAEALQAMLSITASEASKSSTSSKDKPTLQLIQALQDTASHLGEKVDWTVRLVSATQVELDNKQKYLQFVGFARMPPGQVIKFDTGGGNGKVVDFKNEFPVTILTMTQPDLLSSGQAKAVGSGAWTVGMQARVQGRFFRLWSYDSDRVKTSSGAGRLIAPLVMASSITEMRNPPVMNRSGGWWIYLVAMFLVILASGFIQIRLRNRTRRTKPR